MLEASRRTDSIAPIESR